MGVDTIIGSIISVLFSLFGIEEDMQIKFMGRLLRIVFVFMLASIIYATRVSHFRVLPFDKWSIMWFQTPEFNKSLICVIVAYGIFFITKIILRIAVVYFYELFKKWGVKKFGGKTEFIRFLVSIDTLREMKNYLLKNGFLKKKGEKTSYTNKGNRTIKVFAKSVFQIELEGYNFRIDYLNLTGLIFGIISCIYYHLMITSIVLFVLLIYVFIKTVSYMIICESMKVFVKAIKYLKIHELNSNS